MKGLVEVDDIHEAIRDIAEDAARAGLTVVWAVMESNPITDVDHVEYGQKGGFYAALGVSIGLVDWLKSRLSGDAWLDDTEEAK